MIRIEPTQADAGKRLDHILQDRLPEYSRSRLQDWIKQDRVLIGGKPQTKPSYLVQGGELIDVEPLELKPLKAEPEDLPVVVLYEDSDLVAIDKPAGLVVHAGAGHHDGTLVNRLMHRFQNLSQLGGDLRPGIVHRLDRETSGVMLVAKTDAAHRHLANQFASRTTEKTYLALVQGSVAAETGRITSPIARDNVNRTRMTTRKADGRTALTDYKVLKRWPKFTYLEVRIGTGRTHQIRVHLASVRHPVYGDTLYGAQAPPAGFDRFFLHAYRIGFTRPETGERITIESPLPPDLERVLRGLDAAS